MREFLDEYKSYNLSIDIESIVSKVWLINRIFSI